MKPPDKPCPNCSSIDFKREPQWITAKIKSKDVKIIRIIYRCNQCKEPLMTKEDWNECRKNLLDRYKEQNESD